MPEKTRTIVVNGWAANALLARAYQTFDDLNWTIKYAGENLLIAYTPAKWDNIGEEITVKTNNNEISITSKIVDGQTLDITGKNKRHIEDFITLFETVKASSEEILEKWEDKITKLKVDTRKIASEELQQAEEIEKVMKTSSGSLHFSYGIIAVNVLVFIAMVASGISIISPTGEDIVRWGGNYLPLTAAGEWWRLISCVFVHIGIIHLLFNMYALYSIGKFLEPMLGKLNYITAYLCTGVFASLASLWWHQPPVASAGASGAIFGMYGVFLALLSTSLIPKVVRKPLLQSIGIFVFYNLAFGLSAGVDNAAHMGGLLSGFAIGYIFYWRLKNRDETSNNLQPVLLVILTIGAAFFYLQSQKTVSKNDDTEKFSSTVEHFNILEEIALDGMRVRDTTTNDNYLLSLKKTALTDWAECVNVLELAEKMELPPAMETYRKHLIEYSNHRLQQTLLLIKATEEQSDKYKERIDSVQQQINVVRGLIQQEKPIFQ